MSPAAWELWIPEEERRRISQLPPEERRAALRRWYWRWIEDQRPGQGRLFTLDNPGDAGLRELERRAAQGDPTAIHRHRRSLNRAGLCGLCQAAIAGSSAVTADEIRICDVCAALEETEAMRTAVTDYSGYLASVDPELGFRYYEAWPVARVVTAPEGVDQLKVATFTGYPLIAVYQYDCYPITTSYRRVCNWNGLDRWGRMWYGKNGGIGLSTRMKTYKSDQRVGDNDRLPPDCLGRVPRQLVRAQAEWIEAHS